MRFSGISPLVSGIVISLGLLVACLVFPASLFATTTATLITSNLHQRKITLLGITAGRLQYFDADRNLQNISLNKLVALRDISTDQQTKPATDTVSSAPSPTASESRPPQPTHRQATANIQINGHAQVVQVSPNHLLIRPQVAAPLPRGQAPAGRIAHLAHMARINKTPPHNAPDQPKPNAPTTQSSWPGLLTLVDGQRFPGHIVPSPGNQYLTWQSPLGQIHVTVDQIQSLTRPGPESLPTPATEPAASDNTPPTQDVVHLVNGDTLSGFVVSIDDKAVHIAPNGSNTPVALPLKRVRSLSLANPEKQPAQTVQLLTLTTGLRILAQNLSLDDQHLAFTSPLIDSSHKSIRLPADRLAGVDFLSSGFRLIPLTSLARTVTAGGSVLGLRWPPRVIGLTLHLHAPITLGITLPDHAVGFAADLLLDLPPNITAARRHWADCRLTVSSPAGQTGVRLTADHPTARINLPVTGHTLTLSLTAADAAAILDRVQLTSGFVLTKN